LTISDALALIEQRFDAAMTCDARDAALALLATPADAMASSWIAADHALRVRFPYRA